MKKGFSLIEILVLTIMVINILILILGVISNSREFGRTMGCVNNIKNIAQAIEMYQVDFKDTPVTLSSLMPQFIQNPNIFHCPSDREKGDSYSRYYIGRYFTFEDSNKVFLICPRHFGGRKIVCGYLSYSVEIGKSKKVLWSGIPAEFGKTYNGGELNFEDGTKVSITGNVGLLGSFTNNFDKIYSIIYSPEGESTNYSVEHKGNSVFEVITPSLIACVEGTKFNVNTTWISGLNPEAKTEINVIEGTVLVRERKQGIEEKIKEGESIEVTANTYKPEKNIVPRKPKGIKNYNKNPKKS